MKLLLPALLVAASQSAFATNAECLDGKRASLVKGHFTGPLICSKKNATFVLAGRTAGNDYAIYDYRYRFLPHSGGVMHGGQRLVVFHGSRYVGQYTLSPPPYITVTVNGAHVVLSAGAGEKATLDFSAKPPSELFLNGETEGFGR